MDSGNPAVGGAAGGSSAPASEQFVICSAIRPGLKRELAFALKSQTELSATLSRTRLRKLPSSPFPATPPSSSPPPVKKRARNSLSEPFSADAATLQTCSAPVPSAILKTFSTPALAPQNSSAEVRPGFAAETPIVIDDVDTVGPSTGSLAGRREAEPDHVSGNAGGVDVPGWLEQQVSRIAYAGSKYVMHATDEGGSNGGKSNGDSSDANRITRLSSPESVLDSIESTSRDIPSSERTGGKLTRKNLKLHKIVFMEDVLPEGTLLRYVVHGSPKLIGYAKDSGIYCTCCKEVISPSQFEAHAGQAQRRKPYNYIYTSNGVSLHELSVMLLKRRKFSDSENDDLCSICKDAGELVLCDLCPRAFHQACVGLLSIPEGDWHCQYCETMHQRENYVSRNDNARAAGRVPGVDAIDQILNRCILIVKVPDSRDGGCALCRSKDYARSGFGQRTVLICDQCEKEYHVGCLKGHGRDDLKEKPQGEWFCCTDCIKIHAALQNLLAHGTRPLPDLVSEVIKQKHSDKMSNKDGNLDLKWRLFRGKTASMSDKLLLSKAVSVLHESFDPIIGGKKGADLVTQMIYGRWWGHMDFQGMYCAILSVDSFVVSVGILRVLGSEAAELPLVATRKESQGQGYFGALFACIGRLLASLNVKHLVLPATQEAEPMWTQRFGFTKISMEQLYELAQGIKIVNFEDTALLHTAVSDLLPTLGSQVS